MTLDEIRQQYPQYADMTDSQLMEGMRKKFYSDMPADEFASRMGAKQSAPAQQAAPSQNSGDSILRQLGLTARAGIEGLTAIPYAVADPVVKGINKLAGTNMPIPSEASSRNLTRMGFPEPSTGMERFANIVAGGMVQPGALAGVPRGLAIATKTPAIAEMLPATMTNNLGTQIAAAGAGAGGSDLAKEAGFGPVGQGVAGLGAGLLAPASVAAMNTAGSAAVRGVSGLAAPLTEQGRRAIVARALQNAAQDKGAAADNIAMAPSYVPGVKPTTAELANDPGISSLYKAVRNQNTAPFADVEAANDAARQAGLARSFGNATDLQMANAARNEATAPLREAAFANGVKVDTRPIINSANTILKGGAGARQGVQDAMNWVKSRLDGETDPQRIYAIRQDINDIIAGKMRDPEKSSYQLAAGQLTAVRAVLDSQLEKAAPGFKNYLSQYADRSRPIDAMELGQDIAGKALNPMTERLSPASFARQIANRKEEVGNMGAIGSDVLTRVNEDLKRSVAPSITTRVAGSDTLQNMVGNDLLKGISGHVGTGLTGRALSKAASFVYSPAEARVKELLLESMINPDLGRQMLLAQLKQRPDLMAGLLGQRAPIAQGGLLGAMSAQ